jgi:hypothetical protein
MQNRWQQGTNISVYSLLDSAAQGCVHPSISEPWRGMKRTVYAAEIRVCDDQIKCIQVTTADTVPGQLFSSGTQFDVTESGVQVEGGHFEQLL